MLFNYSARDSLGKVCEGVVNAIGRDDVVSRLQKEGLQVINIEEEDEAGDLFPRRIRKSDIIYATNQLAVMVDTGISLSVALGGVAEQEQNSRLRNILQDLKRHVESGEDFSVALARYPKFFDKTFIALVKSSERTGSLGSMLDQVAMYMRKDLENRSKVKAALAYPAVMMVLAASVTTFLLTYVMPKFTPIFERKGAKLPTPTVYLIMLSHSLRDYWHFWILAIIGISLGVFFGRRSEAGRQLIDWAKIHAPIVGPMMRKVVISRCLRTLGTMIRGGVSVLESIRMTSEVAGNYFYKQAWIKVLDDITNGERISTSLYGNSLFPRTLVQMIGAGEETGKLDHVLQKITTYYDSEVEISLKATTSMLEPLMVAIMGVVVGGIGLSLLLPIFSLSRGG